MKRKQKYILLSLLLLSLILCVLFVEPDKEFLFANASGDCSGRSHLMHNAIYKKNQEPETVLFGSSRTMNGIQDSLLNSLPGKKFLNLGYCRFGRNLDYFFIEEYCKYHHPETIVLEVRAQEDANSHAVAPFFLSVPQLAKDAFTGNPKAVGDLYNKWLCNLKFVRSSLFNKPLRLDTQIAIAYGFWHSGKPIGLQKLEEERSRDSIKWLEEKGKHQELNSNSEFYFKKLKQLCGEKKITLYFLYLPNYGNGKGEPAQAAEYRSYGNLLLPPDSLVNNAQYFSDFSHLNPRGAARMSLWLKKTLDP